MSNGKGFSVKRTHFDCSDYGVFISLFTPDLFIYYYPYLRSTIDIDFIVINRRRVREVLSLCCRQATRVTSWASSPRAFESE